MTNKEAIDKLKEILFMTGYKEALAIAIKALERDGTLSYDEVITSGFVCPVCGAIWRDKEDEE